MLHFNDSVDFSINSKKRINTVYTFYFKHILCFIFTINVGYMHGQCPPASTEDSFLWFNSSTNQGAIWDPTTFGDPCALNNTQTYSSVGGSLDITVEIDDPLNQNTDPCNRGTFAPDGINGDYSGTYSTTGYPHDWIDGRFMLQAKASEPDQDVCLSYTFSTPVSFDNFQVTDIDWTADVTVNNAIESTYQDQVNFTASLNGSDVPLTLSYASGAAGTSSFTINGQEAAANYDGVSGSNTGGTNGNVTPSDLAGTVEVSTNSDYIDEITICYANGSADLAHPTTDAGVSDDHAITFEGFTSMCIAPQLNVSGTIFNDADGMMDSAIDGTGIGSPSGIPLFATLIDSNGKIVASVMLQADGTYNFTNVIPGDYEVQIGTTDETNNIGGTAASPDLPADWINTGEGEGPSSTGDGTVDGKQMISLTTSDIVNVDFGIEQPPVANDVIEPTQANPTGTAQVVVPTLDVSDPEDVTPTTITITSLPDLSTEGVLYYNGNPISAGDVITNYNPSLLTLDPIDGDVTVDFTYTTTDAAGIESDVATVTMPFTAPLPVELISFIAKRNNDHVDIFWETASELNNDYFEIQYSNDGKHFRPLERIKGSGTTNIATPYHTVHKNIAQKGFNILYYRLKQIDFNGAFEFSDVRVVEIDIERSGILLYPNPVSKDIRVLNIKADIISKIEVYSASGRLMFSKAYIERTSHAVLDIGTFPKGIYFVKINDSVRKVAITD